jgi:uncharacterized protein (DUF433 family)
VRGAPADAPLLQQRVAGELPATNGLVVCYPHLTAEDIRACLAYASEVLHSERVYPLTTA